MGWRHLTAEQFERERLARRQARVSSVGLPFGQKSFIQDVVPAATVPFECNGSKDGKSIVEDADQGVLGDFSMSSNENTTSHDEQEWLASRTAFLIAEIKALASDLLSFPPSSSPNQSSAAALSLAPLRRVCLALCATSQGPLLSRELSALCVEKSTELTQSLSRDIAAGNLEKVAETWHSFSAHCELVSAVCSSLPYFLEGQPHFHVEMLMNCRSRVTEDDCRNLSRALLAEISRYRRRVCFSPQIHTHSHTHSHMHTPVHDKTEAFQKLKLLHLARRIVTILHDLDRYHSVFEHEALASSLKDMAALCARCNSGEQSLRLAVAFLHFENSLVGQVHSDANVYGRNLMQRIQTWASLLFLRKVDPLVFAPQPKFVGLSICPGAECQTRTPLAALLLRGHDDLLLQFLSCVARVAPDFQKRLHDDFEVALRDATQALLHHLFGPTGAKPIPYAEEHAVLFHFVKWRDRLDHIEASLFSVELKLPKHPQTKAKPTLPATASGKQSIQGQRCDAALSNEGMEDGLPDGINELPDLDGERAGGSALATLDDSDWDLESRVREETAVGVSPSVPETNALSARLQALPGGNVLSKNGPATSASNNPPANRAQARLLNQLQDLKTILNALPVGGVFMPRPADLQIFNDLLTTAGGVQFGVGAGTDAPGLSPMRVEDGKINDDKDENQGSRKLSRPPVLKKLLMNVLASEITAARQLGGALIRELDRINRHASSTLSLTADRVISNIYPHILKLFVCLPEKNFVGKLHEDLMAKRLFKTSSPNLRLERFFVDNLKADCGENFVQKMRQLDREYENSLSLNAAFKQYMAERYQQRLSERRMKSSSRKDGEKSLIIDSGEKLMKDLDAKEAISANRKVNAMANANGLAAKEGQRDGQRSRKRRKTEPRIVFDPSESPLQASEEHDERATVNAAPISAEDVMMDSMFSSSDIFSMKVVAAHLWQRSSPLPPRPDRGDRKFFFSPPLNLAPSLPQVDFLTRQFSRMYHEKHENRLLNIQTHDITATLQVNIQTLRELLPKPRTDPLPPTTGRSRRAAAKFGTRSQAFSHPISDSQDLSDLASHVNADNARAVGSGNEKKPKKVFVTTSAAQAIVLLKFNSDSELSAAALQRELFPSLEVEEVLAECQSIVDAGLLYVSRDSASSDTRDGRTHDGRHVKEANRAQRTKRGNEAQDDGVDGEEDIGVGGGGADVGTICKATSFFSLRTDFNPGSISTIIKNPAATEGEIAQVSEASQRASRNAHQMNSQVIEAFVVRHLKKLKETTREALTIALAAFPAFNDTVVMDQLDAIVAQLVKKGKKQSQLPHIAAVMDAPARKIKMVLSTIPCRLPDVDGQRNSLCTLKMKYKDQRKDIWNIEEKIENELFSPQVQVNKSHRSMYFNLPCGSAGYALTPHAESHRYSQFLLRTTSFEI